MAEAPTIQPGEEFIERLATRMAATMAASMADELEHVLTRVATAPPAIPISIDLWDFNTIARYLKRTSNYVRTEIASQSGFPSPIRLPRDESKVSHPLYRATEIIAWAESLRQGPGRSA
jgi:hypothetical protein